MRRAAVRGTPVARTADGGFLICFADATEERGRIPRRGDGARNPLPADRRRRDRGDSERSAVAAAVEVPTRPGQPADMLATIIGERLNGRLAQIEADARNPAQHDTATCQVEPVHSRRTKEIVAHFARLPREQEQSILAAYSALPMQDRQGFDFDRLVLGVAAEPASPRSPRVKLQIW